MRQKLSLVKVQPFASQSYKFSEQINRLTPRLIDNIDLQCFEINQGYRYRDMVADFFVVLVLARLAPF